MVLDQAKEHKNTIVYRFIILLLLPFMLFKFYILTGKLFYLNSTYLKYIHRVFAVLIFMFDNIVLVIKNAITKSKIIPSHAI